MSTARDEMRREAFTDYVRFSSAVGRVNDPADFIAFLRQTRFPNGELENLPKHAIILHDSRLEEFLDKLGIAPEHRRPLQTGVTDPNLIYVVTAPDRPPFLLNRGMPGGGAVATQAAELVALGATHLVHVGTCGLVGDTVPSGSVVASRAAFTDGSAALLARSEEEARGRVAYPDAALTERLIATLKARGDAVFPAASYTVPIFYFQPAALIVSLITGGLFPDGPTIGYFEMEEAAFFATCALMGAAGASLVVGSDRYRLAGDGTLTHQFEEDVDQDATELRILEAILDTFAALPATTTLPEEAREKADLTARPFDREH